MTASASDTTELSMSNEKEGTKSSDGANDTRDAATARETVVATAHGRFEMGRTRAMLIVTTLAGVNFLNTLGGGILTVSLPTMAHDVALDESLILWPASVYALSAGCSLLIFGTVGDVIGPKKVWVIGASFYAAFTLAVGLCRSAAQLIAFRTILGLSISMCLPTAVSLTTRSFLPGRWRNMAFACQGMGQPLGYSLGLILGGVFTDTIGWRWGFHISAIINALLAACAFWVLPAPPNDAGSHIVQRLRKDIDWIGALTISASLGLLSFELAEVSRDRHNLEKAYNIVLLVLAFCLIPVFILWVRRQERLGRPALIPNSLWANASFTTTCVTVFVTWASFNSIQYFSSLYLERIEGLSAIQTSVRLLPMVFVGVATNLVTGFLVEKTDVRDLVTYSAIVTLVAPLLMALVMPDWGYWKGPFVAMCLCPLHPDVLFTVSNLIISKAYPGKSQSLAGAVFNTAAQIGNSVGLAVTAAIASSVTQSQGNNDSALLAGYHAAFWLMFASMVLIVPLTFFGLKRGGKVGASE